ncbi:hypothetical protein [Sphingopyxis sp. R3-92]|uniref:hypothetical protein n=1 Tax=Sphingopyxis sp. R3-92 TaxID=3158553 RepID=UPI003EE59EC4
MSTMMLLILSAYLRGLAHADGHRDPAPPAALIGRGRVTRRVASSTSRIRRSNAGTGSLPTLLAERAILPLACAGAPITPLRRARVLLLPVLLLAPGSQPAQARPAHEHPVLELPPLQVEASKPDAPQDEQRIGGGAPQGPCVIIDIAGERAGHLDCATRKLTDAARIAQNEARAGIDAPIPQAGSPDARVGVVNQTAARLRMGSGFGTSVHSERPVSRPPRVPRP